MAKNVIIMVGDGLGWEMTRASAIQQLINDGATGDTLSDFYTEGTGFGLGFQELDGYALATTGGTYIDGSKNNSALEGDTLDRETGIAVIREGYNPDELPFFDENGDFLYPEVVGFNLDENGNFIGVDENGDPLVDENGDPIVEVGSNAPILGIFDPGFDERAVFAQTADGELVQVGGLLNAYDTTQGRDVPWEADENPDYPKNIYPDSANTATTLYTGVKSYNGAIGVDIYEEDIQALGEIGREVGKSFGVVTSVPFNHATPAAAIGHVSQRNKLTATSRTENFEIALDENGVPLHEDHSHGTHEGDPVYVRQDGTQVAISDEDFANLTDEEKSQLVLIEDDNILYQILNETQPEVVLGGGHPDGRGDERYIDLATLEQLRNGETVYTFTERGEGAAETLAQVASNINVNEGEKLFGLYGARGQGGNLPWLTADGDYSNTGLSSRLDAVRPLEEGETDAEFIASEIDANPTLADLTSAALDVLGDDEDGFWLMIEQGDIDWAMHDNNLDNGIGATLSFDQAFKAVDEWIQNNGGYEDNLLIVTADHDHYLTLNEDFPELLRTVGAEGLTTEVDENSDPIIITDSNGNPTKVDNTDTVAAGHYWGSDPTVMNGWAHHTQIPVPVYFEGPAEDQEMLEEATGKGFESYGFNVPGLEGLIDQVHIAQTMIQAVDPAPKLVGFSSLRADTFAPGLPGGSGNEVENPTNGRETPFDNQPVQGFSGVQFAGEDTYWFLSDNGYGSKANSADYLLRIYEVDPNFTTEEGGSGEAQWTNFIQLADPNNLIPFEIEQEGTAERLLTGADFDIESFVLTPDGEIWVGEEFGPYLLKFDTTGTLLEAPIPTPNEIEFNTLNGQDPLVIGHRGASGDLPEHTLEAYALAIEQGADFVEPDLVITSDGVLIARHEPMLDDTTNVADVFGPERQSTKILDGQEITAYFAEDFTLAEIKQLRAVQPRDFRDQSFNDQFEIPTLQEVIELVQDVEAQTGNQVGIYPETKHPTFFDEQGLSLEEPLIQTLQDTGFTDPSRIFIQSFEFQNLIELQGQLDAEGLGDIPLVQLYGRATDSANPNEPFSVPYDIRFNLEQGNDLAAIYGQDFLDAAENPLSLDTTYQDLDNAEFLQVISDSYAEGAGPWKNNFLLRESLDTPVDGDGDGVAEITSQLTGEVTSFVDDAHAAGLQVHPYTLRDEERFLTLNADGTPQTPEQEFQQLIEIGVDGFFTDFPETGAMEVAKLTQDFVASPDNPDVLAGNAIDNLRRSRGFEGMAYSPDYETLYPMLEGAVVGDPANAVRIYEFDVASETYGSDIVGFYGLDDASHAIGDFTPINDTEFLVIERDGGQGDAAQFKKIFKVDFSEVDGEGFVEKEELVDLLNVADPNDLNGDGLQTFDFPFVTIEDVLVLDENTILVANDNNYPFSIGRGPDIDNNEIIKIELTESLDLDPRLGMPEDEPENPVVSGGNDDDNFDAVFSEDFDGNGQLLFTGGGDDQVNLSYAEGGNTVTTSSGDDTLFAWTGDRLDAGAGEDKIFLGAGGGGNLVTGGADADTFYLTQDDNLLPANPNTIGDFNQSEGDLLGFLATSLEFGSSDLNFTQDGANTIIEAFGQEVAILNGVNAASLTEQNFMFA